MKQYIDGYYCRDDLHLQIINKDTNRKILEALRLAYPSGLTVEELAQSTGLPIKTIYAQKAELYREYYVDHLDDLNPPKRGRPSQTKNGELARRRVRIVIEDAKGIHDIYEGKKPTPLPAGNVTYSEGFIEALQEIIEKNEKDELCLYILQFIKKLFNRIYYLDKSNIKNCNKIKNWIPEKSMDFCCIKCGLNHEVRDFVRATLLHLIDYLEDSDDFIDFLKDNKFITIDAYKHIDSKIRKKSSV
jgi:hypothetical protein